MSDWRPLTPQTWIPRARLAAAWLRDVPSVTDIGCWKMHLEPLLPKGVNYVPIDVAARDARTIVVDLNTAPLPNTSTEAAAVLGVLEYLTDADAFVAALAQYRRVVFTYNVQEWRPPGMLWVNTFTAAEIEQLFARHGFLRIARRAVSVTQMIWWFERGEVSSRRRAADMLAFTLADGIVAGPLKRTLRFAAQAIIRALQRPAAQPTG